jgi:hypothetical protein
MRVTFGQGFLFSPPTTLAFHVPDLLEDASA